MQESYEDNYSDEDDDDYEETDDEETSEESSDDNDKNVNVKQQLYILYKAQYTSKIHCNNETYSNYYLWL